MKTFEYRLFVNKRQYALLMQCLRESRIIYNEMLEITKQQYEDKGTFPTKYDLTAQFKGRGGAHSSIFSLPRLQALDMRLYE